MAACYYLGVLCAVLHESVTWFAQHPFTFISQCNEEPERISIPRCEHCLAWQNITHLLHYFFLLVLLQRAKAVVAKKEEGNAQIKLGNYQAAYDIYSEALEVDEVNVSLNSKLYCNRALAASKVGIHLVLPHNIHNIISYVYVYVCITYTTLESDIN